MRLSPLDVQHQEFDGALSGFSKKQVREFLNKVADEFEDLLRENQQLREEISKRDQKIEDLQVGEAELKRAVVAAERIGNELKTNAQREAELITEGAKATKAKILEEVELELKNAQLELERLQREQRLFREQFRGLLYAYERSLDNLAEAKPAKDDDKALADS